MAFRLVQSGGSVQDPAMVNMAASGVIRPNSVVVFDTATNAVSVASSGSSYTNVIGVALDYVQGASDTFTRVIPFVPGQLWEADCANVAATTNLFIRHQLFDSVSINNVTSGVYGSLSTDCFFAVAMAGLTTGSGKLIGYFLQRPSFRGKDGVTATT